MELLGDILSSLAGAPGTGIGPAPAVAGAATSSMQETPQACMQPHEDEEPPVLETSIDDAPRRHQGLKDHYYSISALKSYGDWLVDGSTPVRAAKAATGLVVLPMGAALTCLEDTVRSYTRGFNIGVPEPR